MRLKYRLKHIDTIFSKWEDFKHWLYWIPTTRIGLIVWFLLSIVFTCVFYFNVFYEEPVTTTAKLWASVLLGSLSSIGVVILGVLVGLLWEDS